MIPIRLAQISDFHFTKLTWNPLWLFSKRLLGNLNWVLARKTTFSSVHLEALPPLLASLKLDRILLGGDFTTSSLHSEFQIAQKLVEQFPKPWIAVPGNHDCYTFSACRQKVYYDYFANEGANDRYTLREHRVERHDLGQKWNLIALDTARATPFYTSSGLFSEPQELHLKKLLAKIPADHKIILFNHYPFFNNDSPQRSLVRADALESMIKKDPRIKMYLHGHTHRHIIANLQPSRLPVILDGGCSADIQKGSWNLLTIDDQGLTVDVYKWGDGWHVVRQERMEWTR